MTLTVGLCLRLIDRCSRSAVYRTREMAARALVPFVLLTQVPSTVCSLLQELPTYPGPHIQHNHIHGTLLQVWWHASYTNPAPPLYAMSAVAVNCGCNNCQMPLGGYTVLIATYTRTWINTPWLQWVPDSCCFFEEYEPHCQRSKLNIVIILPNGENLKIHTFEILMMIWV